jgi:hypothetical protein
MDFTPAEDAPRMAFIDAISSSIWIKIPSTSGILEDRVAGKESASAGDCPFCTGHITIEEMFTCPYGWFNVAHDQVGVLLQGFHLL